MATGEGWEREKECWRQPQGQLGGAGHRRRPPSVRAGLGGLPGRLESSVPGTDLSVTPHGCGPNVTVILDGCNVCVRDTQEYGPTDVSAMLLHVMNMVRDHVSAPV